MSANHDFKVGDMVQLKPGGLEMGVEKLEGDTVQCVWSDGRKVLSRSFPAALLMKVLPIEKDERIEELLKKTAQPILGPSEKC